jgi:para-nitrobenzyl esterase
MVRFWANFARSGNPNGQGLPEWPQTSSAKDVWLELDDTPEPIEGLRARKLDILEEALLRRLTAVAGAPPAAEPAAETTPVPEVTPVLPARQPVQARPRPPTPAPAEPSVAVSGFVTPPATVETPAAPPSGSE